MIYNIIILNIKSLNYVLKDVDLRCHVFIVFINWLVHGTCCSIYDFFSYLILPSCRSVS